MTPIDLDAAQRTIEADSFLMGQYLRTDEHQTISKRIEYIFFLHIRHDKRFYKKYVEILKGLEK